MREHLCEDVCSRRKYTFLEALVVALAISKSLPSAISTTSFRPWIVLQIIAVSDRRIQRFLKYLLHG